MRVPRQPTYEPLADDELVFALVYGAGTEVDTFQRLLRDRLEHHGYIPRQIHLSDFFGRIVREDIRREAPDVVRRLQDAGDKIRECTEDNGILGDLSAYLIGLHRASEGAVARTAWILQSFKRREEIRELRRIYGARLIVLGIHVPEAGRQRTQAHRWQRWAPVTSRRFQDEASRDIQRDEHDPAAVHGQAFRSAFAESDFFIDARTDARLEETLPRFIRILFGEPFEPPYRDEQAMYHAYTAGLRSAEMGRQVGAAIVNPDGDLLSVGTNEVPSGRGGLYWSPDEPNGRDYAQPMPLDSNTLWQRRISRELLVRMVAHGWAEASRFQKLETGDTDVTEETLDRFLDDVDGTRFHDITEFGRAVHAEMDALTMAARLGVSVKGAHLVCTTYPCHSCTRHIVASGITRLVFMFPYAKSLARDLHWDSVVFEPEESRPIPGKVRFEQYIGVAPRCYPQYFSFGQTDRKDDRGRAMRAGDPLKAVPRPLEERGPFAFGGSIVPHPTISDLEKEATRKFVKLATGSGLAVPRTLGGRKRGTKRK